LSRNGICLGAIFLTKARLARHFCFNPLCYLSMRVVIVDDHILVRSGLCRLLHGFSGVHVVGEADTAAQALQQVDFHCPDIVLLDISLPDRSGLEVLVDIKRKQPHVHVVILSMHDEVAQVHQALERGASAYVVKDALPTELELALNAAYSGQLFISPKVSAKTLAPLLPRKHQSAQPANAMALLTPRQQQILRQLAQGHTTKEIAAQLGISNKTVETHRARMMETLGCRRANELLLLAARHMHDGLMPVTG